VDDGAPPNDSVVAAAAADQIIGSKGRASAAESDTSARSGRLSAITSEYIAIRLFFRI